MPATAGTKLKRRKIEPIVPPTPVTPIKKPKAEKGAAQHVFMPRPAPVGASAVLLNFDKQTLEKLDKHVNKLQELYSYIPKEPKVKPEDLKEAMRISRENGSEAANKFLADCKRKVTRRRTPPSRRTFVYNLIFIGLQQYETKPTYFQDLILYGSPVIDDQPAQQ